MEQAHLAAVILAAGKGTRMKSALPKVLHPLCGYPLAHYPARLTSSLGCRPSVMVVGHRAAAVETALADPGLSFARQDEQLGTGHALLCARPLLADFRGTLLLLCGDVPLLRRQTVERLLACHNARGAAVTVLTAVLADPHGYGRIIREADQVLRIVEEKDASPAERAVKEVNSGIYAFAAPFVFEALQGVTRNNAQGEYYLTDVVAAARAAGHVVTAVAATEAEETMGINDRVQLAEANTILRRRINEQMMQNGVTLIDPAAAYIDPDVEIGEDTIIHPGVHLRGRTRLGRECVVEPGVVVSDCTIGDRVHLKAGSVLAEATVGSDTDVGPMAHLRPGTVLAGHNKIGNFVETKKAVLGQGSKASHLTYLGDTDIGAEVNIGCGTITCNYDGVNKHKTIIEDHVFVGSDTQFVAPVRIGRNSLIAAGSTITRDVPPDSLALARTPQVNKDGWRLKKKT